MTNLSALAESAGPAPGVTGPTRKPAGRKPLGIDEVRRSAVRAPAHTRVIGYVTVPPGAGAGAARASSARIEVACARSGWTLLETVRDRERGRILERPGLRYALERIARKRADVLLVGEMRRLSRSIVDLGALMAWFLDIDATLIALDLPIDTSTAAAAPEVASTLIALADWERERIAQPDTARPGGGPRPRPARRPAGGRRRPGAARAHLGDARDEHDAARHRRSAQRRTGPDAARRDGVAALEHPDRARLPAARTA